MPEQPTASSPSTFVAPSPIGGRGVFARRSIGRGRVVEVAPVIVMPADEVDALEATSLRDHWYGWTDDGDAAVAFGHASFYNHAADANCEYEAAQDQDALVIRARRPIAAGEELTIDYTGGGVTPLWFEASPARSGPG